MLKFSAITKNWTNILFIFAVLFSTQPVFAQSATIQFTGTVSERCDIILKDEGNLGENDSRTQLSSELPGGRPSTASFNCNKSTHIEISEPIQSSNYTLNRPVAVSKLTISGCENENGVGNTVMAGSTASGYKQVANSGDFGWNPETIRGCSSLKVSMSITNGGGKMLPMGDYSFQVKISAVSP